jgi:hypothetical protein
MEFNTILMRDSMVLIIEKNVKQAVKRLLVLESPLATTWRISISAPVSFWLELQFLQRNLFQVGYRIGIVHN